MTQNSLIVRAGQELSAGLWNAFWKERRQRRIKAGPGVLTKETRDCVIISFRGAATPWMHPYKSALSGASLTFRSGLVNGWEPRIDGVPLSGTETEPVPSLKLRDTADLYDITGRSWILIRAGVDEVGRLIQPDAEGKGDLDLTIVQKNRFLPTDPDDDTIGYCPIAVLVRPKDATSGLGKLRQIAMFDYQLRTARKNEKWRHFFSPA